MLQNAPSIGAAPRSAPEGGAQRDRNARRGLRTPSSPAASRAGCARMRARVGDTKLRQRGGGRARPRRRHASSLRAPRRRTHPACQSFAAATCSKSQDNHPRAAELQSRLGAQERTPARAPRHGPSPLLPLAKPHGRGDGVFEQPRAGRRRPTGAIGGGGRRATPRHRVAHRRDGTARHHEHRSCTPAGGLEGAIVASTPPRWRANYCTCTVAENRRWLIFQIARIHLPCLLEK